MEEAYQAFLPENLYVLIRNIRFHRNRFSYFCHFSKGLLGSLFSHFKMTRFSIFASSILDAKPVDVDPR